MDSAGHIGGFAEVSIRREASECQLGRVGFLEGWFVEEPFRRSGTGAALVAAAEEWSRAQGCSEFASDTETHNELSIAAHHALGFEEVERLVCFRKATKACRTTGGCVKTDMDQRISRRSRSPRSCRKTVQHLALLSGFKCLPSRSTRTN